jgi:hypothetical protein
MKRQIPYGSSNFEQIRRENNYYIDKTMFIEKLETVNHCVLLRPRRFGKSLTTEMLRWYYDISAANRFHELFGDLYIGKNPTPHRNKYFVLVLSFTGMEILSNENDQLANKFSNHLSGYYISFLSKYRNYFNIDENYIDNFFSIYKNDASNGLKKILQLVENQNSQLYLCIDEYDSLTNALAIRYRYANENDNLYLNILKKGGFFRNFFEAIKDGTSNTIAKVYITGILPITISDMKSGFNIASWLTFNPKFETMGL